MREGRRGWVEEEVDKEQEGQEELVWRGYEGMSGSMRVIKVEGKERLLKRQWNGKEIVILEHGNGVI